jgi:hypothetical protein
MYYDDHPPPHFHAIYGEHEAKIAIESEELIEGSLPRRAPGLVLEWAKVHKQDLRDNWLKGEEHEPLSPIRPLE